MCHFIGTEGRITLGLGDGEAPAGGTSPAHHPEQLTITSGQPLRIRFLHAHLALLHLVCTSTGGGRLGNLGQTDDGEWGGKGAGNEWQLTQPNVVTYHYPMPSPAGHRGEPAGSSWSSVRFVSLLSSCFFKLHRAADALARLRRRA